MPAQSWANPDQKVFLKSRALAFAQAQNEKKLAQFWVDVCKDFFAQWPTPQSERLSKSLSTKNKRKKKRGNNSEEPFY